MKICLKCKIEKPFDEFYKHKYRKDGYSDSCQICCSDINRNYYKSNKEKVSLRVKAWRDVNKDKVSIYEERHRLNNRDRRKESSKKWSDANPDKKAYQANKRRALKLTAQPSWANEFFIREAYSLAKLRTEIFGFPWHVDHVIPLQNKLVCGLHVEHNLRVIPASENLNKSNKFEII